MAISHERPYRRVLVPLDGSLASATALKVGSQLADRWGADLHAITLIEKGQIPSGVHHLTERILKRIEASPKVEIRKVAYSTAEDIAGEFDRVQDTFVVMSSWGRGRSAGVVPNLAEEVFRLVRQPMLLTGPKVEVTSAWPSGPLHISVDGSDFSETIVKPALLFAESLGLDIRFVTVLNPAETPGGANAVGEANILARLAGRAQGIVGHEVNYDVLHASHPSREIPDYANRYGASAIAMASHLRSGPSRLAHGSVVMDVVSQARCPVLIDRPPIGEP